MARKFVKRPVLASEMQNPEVMWDDMSWHEQIAQMQQYVSTYKGTRVFEDFAEYVGKDVEDIIDGFCDAESHGDLKIPQRMQKDSDYANDDLY